jgi:hypothetical protein
MTIWRLVVIIFVLLGAAPQGHAQTYFKKGNGLVEELRQFERAERNDQNAQEFGAGSYVGYVLGVADAHTGIFWCPGRGGGTMNVRQVVEIVSKYINSNPELWHLQADILVLNALRQAFPCKK